MAMLLKITLVLLAAVMAVECWRIIPGRLIHVTASIHYLWGVDRHHRIFMCQQPCTNGRWRGIRGHLAQVDAGMHEVWGAKNGYIFKRNIDGSGGWKHIPFYRKAFHVTASGHGYIYVIDRQRHVYKCKQPCKGNRAFMRIAYVPGGAKQIDAGFFRVYAINRRNQVFTLSLQAPRNARWRRINGRLHYISVGGINVFGMSGQYAYRCNYPCNGRWRRVKMDSCLVNPRQIDASINSVVAVDSRQLIFTQFLRYGLERFQSAAVEGTSQIEQDKNDEEEENEEENKEGNEEGNGEENGDEKKEEKEGREINEEGNGDEKKEDKDEVNIIDMMNGVEATLAPYVEDLENMDAANNEGGAPVKHGDDPDIKN